MGVGIIATSHQMIFQERFSELNSVVYAIYVERIPVCVGSLVRTSAAVRA
jgi:hypothetical protein